MKETTSAPKTKTKRADGQVTGLAGELFVAAELLKRGLQTSVTFGNAKAIDLLAYNPETEKAFTVQVKSVRKRNAFPISHERVEANHTYVFVILNRPGVAVQYFVVPGSLLAKEPERFTKWFTDPKFPGIPPAALEPFENAWQGGVPPSGVRAEGVGFAVGALQGPHGRRDQEVIGELR